MPSQQAHLETFRLSGHRLFAYASIYKGRLVLEGEITVAPTLYPIKYLIYSVTTGSADDIRSGFRVDICTPSGRLKVRTRVRFGNISDANVISVRELGKGSGSIEVGDLVRVYRDLRLSDKLVDNSQFFNPDGTAFSDQGQNPQPVPISGGAWAGWKRMLPALGTGTGSYTLDPDSAGTVTHLWDGDGLTVDDDEAADVEFTGDAGEYLVEHTVTDASNGKSKTAYIPYIVHDAEHPPYKIEIENLPNDEQRGGSARIRFLDNVLIDDVPDGALIILWKDEYVGGTRQSFGARAPGRSHVLFVGYWRSEEGAFDSSTGVESLRGELISPLARLDELMGYSKVMLRDANPNAWNKIKALDVKRGVVQIPMEYTTLGESGLDFIFRPSFRNEAYSGFFLEASTPIGQMRELANSTQGRVVEDMRGRFEVQMRPDQVALDERATTLAVTLSASKRDLKSWRYTREHFNTHNRIEVHGLVAGASTENNVPLFSQWVGEAPGEGTQQQTFERVIIPATNSQDALDKIAGRLGAAMAGEFIDENGVKHTAIELETVHRGVYDVFDFYDEVVEFNFATNKRGIDFSEHQFVLMGVNRTFGGGTYETTCRWRTCTNGLQGEPYTPADETGTLPDYPYPEWTPTPQPAPATTGLIPGETGQLPLSGWVLNANAAKASKAVAFDPGSGTITFSDINTGLTGNGVDGYSNPHNYRETFALMDTGLHRTANRETFTTWALLKSNAALFGSSGRLGHKAKGSHLRAGWGMTVSGENVAVVTFDGWNSVTASSINGAGLSYGTVAGGDKWCDFCICGHNANHIIALAPSIVHSGTWSALWRSTDGGLNWALLTDFPGVVAIDTNYVDVARQWIEVPYTRLDGTPNLDDANLEIWLYASGDVNTGQSGRIYILGAAGTSLLASAFFTFTDNGAVATHPMTTFTHDSSYAWYVASRYLKRTEDGFSTTTSNLFDMGNGAPKTTSMNGISTNRNVAIAWSTAGGGGAPVLRMTLDGSNWFGNVPPSWGSSDGCAYAEFSLYDL